MAVIKATSVNGISACFWMLKEHNCDHTMQSASMLVDIYSCPQDFLDGKDPLDTIVHTYKGASYPLQGTETGNDVPKAMYEQLKTEIGGGYDYPTANEPWCPKIYNLLKPDVSLKHFHNIDYTIELNTVLHRQDTFGLKGLLTKVEYFSDANKTDKVLEFNRTYTTHPVDGVTHKHTTRTYYNVDNTPNSDIKDRGNYEYTTNQSRKATIRRRENITFNIEKELIDMIKVQSAPEDLIANMQNAAAFASHLSPMKNSFISSGDSTLIVTEINKAQVQTDYPFLLWEKEPGVTAVDFITNEVNY